VFKTDFKPNSLFCTSIAEKILTAGKNGLKHHLADLVKHYSDIELDKSQAKGFKCGQDLTTEQIAYAANDVIVLRPIFEQQAEKLEAENLISTAQLEFSIVAAIADMELKGVTIDKALCESLKAEAGGEAEKLECEMDEYLVSQGIKPAVNQKSLFISDKKQHLINYNSRDQLLPVLKRLGVNVSDAQRKTLEKIKHPFVEKRLKFKKTKDLISKLLKPLPTFINSETNRIHANFHQLGANASGRFSCSKPNLQQIHNNQKYRNLIVAPKGYKFITADYSQIELRILAEISNDQAMIEVFKSGKDLHTETAAAVNNISPDTVTKEQRSAAKTVNFGLVYGKHVSTLAKDLQISEAQAQRLVEKILGLYPKAKEYLQRCETEVFVKKYAATINGRKRYFTDDELERFENSVKREARNSPIQGTGADIIKQAIFETFEKLKALNVHLVLTVHDELVFEAPEETVEQAKVLIETGMIKAARTYLKQVPIKVDIEIDKVWRK
jgi:DNA polymerase I-like protein with 3'-5' exonuclease and polymerase domains